MAASNDQEQLPNIPGTVARFGFEKRETWELTVEKLLGHWAFSIKMRIAQHEKMANKALMLDVLRLPLMLFALVMSAVCMTTSVELRAAAFWLLAVGQVAMLFLDPSGWRERHLNFAERYNDLYNEMADALDKPRNQRMQRGGPPISTLVTRRQSHFRQGLADEPFVKAPTKLDADMVGNSMIKVLNQEGSQQSQLLLAVSCRLNKLEGCRPRQLIDWTFSAIPTGI